MQTRRQFLVTLAGGAAALAVSGCGSSASSSNGLTPSQTAAIDALANAQAGTTTPGVQLGISCKGNILLMRGYGERTLAPNAPMLANTPMRIGSVTKQFTVACILLLQERGLLSVDDPLSKYVPEISYGNQITLRNMLNNVSGLTPDATVLFNPPVPFTETTPSEYLTRLNQQPLVFAPGTEYQYSNPNFWLAGLIVERVSQMSYSAFLQSQILSNAGLVSSYVVGSQPDVNAALGYNPVEGGTGFVLATPWADSYLFSTGGLVSTVADILTWNISLTSGLILNPSSLATMFQVPVLASGAKTSYAMGWLVGQNVTWHNGQLYGFHAMNAMFADGYNVVALGNEGDSTNLWSPENLAVAVHAVLNPDLQVKLLP